MTNACAIEGGLGDRMIHGCCALTPADRSPVRGVAATYDATRGGMERGRRLAASGVTACAWARSRS